MKIIIFLLALPLMAADAAKIDSGGRFSPGTSGTLPSTCSVGQLFFKTGVTAGQNMYGCTATNTWTLEAGGGGGITVLTTGSGAPVASCTAPSTSNLAKYYDSTNHKMWTCVATNTWEEDITVDPTAAFLITGNAGTAPGTPATGKGNIYIDTVQKGLSIKDDAGQITRTVKPTDCSSTGLVQKINADGTVTCAAGSGGAQTIFISPNGFQVVASGSAYSGPGGAIGGANSGYDVFRGIFAVSGTMSNLCAGIDHTVPQPANGSLVFTALKNGSPTTLSVAVPAGTSPPYYICDTTHTVSVTATTDAISFVITNNSTDTVSAFPSSMSYQFQ